MKKWAAGMIAMLMLACTACGGHAASDSGGRGEGRTTDATDNTREGLNETSEPREETMESEPYSQTDDRLSTAKRDAAVRTSNPVKEASSTDKATGGDKTTVSSVAGPADPVKDLGLTKEMMTASLYSEGNRSRLAAVMKKARDGGKVTIGFLGGSITDGSNVPAGKSYAQLVYSWWKTTFPQAAFEYVNAGIGSTGSVIGVHRMDQDLLAKKPDFVILEFAVNDGTDTETQRAYEGSIRKILSAPQGPALMLLFMCTNGGYGAQDAHAAVGRHYDLPMISYRNALNIAVRDSVYPWTKFSDDTVHPNEFGYAACAAFINSFLADTHRALDAIPAAGYAVPRPLNGDFYTSTRILGSDNHTPQSLGGWKPAANALYFHKNGWEVKGGDERPLVFEVEAKRVWLLYKQDITGTKGKAAVYLNDEYACDLNGEFVDGWGDLGALQLVAKADAKRKFTISIRMKPNQKKDFVLAAVYISE